MPAPRAPLQRQTVTGMVADYITSKIISGEFAGGQSIRQDAIAAELGVSRIPVREALLQLEGEGLVVIKTHRGAVVADLSANDAIDLFDARQLLEPFLVKKAIEQASDEEIAAVGQALNAYEAAISRGNPEELSRLNWAFHTALIAPSRRTRSIAVVQTLFNSSDRYLRLQIEPLKAQTKALAEHQTIFDAYQARDASTTAKLVKKHIADASEDILGQLESHGLPG